MKKLRNKITGEVNEFMIHKRIEDSEDGNPVYAPFDGNIDEWEDVPEEPKEYWFIDEFGLVQKEIEYYYEENKEAVHDKRIAVGNYFETKEEAEQAVEKLKAFKRLKDNGFEFRRWEIIDGTINFMILPKGDYREKVYEDLDICFGGEE